MSLTTLSKLVPGHSCLSDFLSNLLVKRAGPEFRLTKGLLVPTVAPNLSF
jgi:hypothetical protein